MEKKNFDSFCSRLILWEIRSEDLIESKLAFKDWRRISFLPLGLIKRFF